MDKPQGGTELQRDWLFSLLPSHITERIQLMCRAEEIDPNRIPILWVQDMPADVPFITDPNTRAIFGKIVFVSAWQQTVFNINAGVPFAESAVIKNAIYPIEPEKKPSDQIRLIYHPTPHRGLEILVPVFERLAARYSHLHLDVFSNYDIYARGHLNPAYETLYERCRRHPQITYHGSQSNDVVRLHLARAHIFAYPSIWRETSCMSAMEAMTARCITVAPNYGALSETLANFNVSYDWHEDKSEHEKIFETKLVQAMESIGSRQADSLLDEQKSYADRFYNKETRIDQWIEFLENVARKPNKSQGGFQWMT